jgi:hypothetical protein
VSSYRTKPDDMHKVSNSLRVTRTVRHYRKPNCMNERAQS